MTNIDEALDCLRYDYDKKGYRIDPGMGQKLYQIIDERIESETDFYPDRYRLSKKTLIEAYEDAVIELANETHEQDDIDFEGEFQKKKTEILCSTLGAELKTYTIVFPLNLRAEAIPDSFSMMETEIVEISEEKWKGEYEKPARDADETSLNAFLEESPNNLEERDGLGGKFTFWKMEYEARDHHYALSQIPKIVRLFLGKFNFVLYKWSAGVPQPAGGDKPPNARWSQLKEPFVYLVFEGDEYQNYWPYDYDLRRHSEGIRGDIEERMSYLKNLPDLPAERSNLEGVDELLVNALLAYQDGITETSTHQSFFAFWRGLENLSQIGRSESNKVVVDRAVFALENVTDRSTVRPELKEAIDQIHQKRNELTHEGPHTGISQHHRSASKILLDALLELYFTYYEKGYSKEDFRVFLKYGALSEEEREDKRDTFNRDIDILDEVQRFEDSSS